MKKWIKKWIYYLFNEWDDLEIKYPSELLIQWLFEETV